MKKILLPLLIALIFIATLVFLYRKSQPVPVTYAQLRPVVADVEKTTIITGNIEPRDEIEIKPQISGIITDIFKEAGDYVNEGDIIAKVKVIPDMSSLSSAEARLRLAKINLSQSETDFHREQVLYDRGVISASEYDQQRLAYNQAQEEVAAAQDALEVVRDGVSASNASASSTLIRATISGIILDIPVKVGNSVILSNTFNDGTTIAYVADMNDLIFRGNIDETDVGSLTEGMPMQITIGALQNLRFQAQLEYISPKATDNNGANQFEVKAAVSNIPTGSAIRSGYSANAEIVLSTAPQVLTLPESAIEFEGDSTYVYLLDNNSNSNTYVRQPVTIGLSDGINIEIKSGLTPTSIVRGSQIL